jgi:hypothetical protein
MPPNEDAALPGSIWKQVLLPVLVADGINNTNSPGDADKATSSISQEAVCQLLCSSKGIGRAVRSECSGQLCANFSARSLQQAEQFAAWLTRNGSLVKQLQFSCRSHWDHGSASLPVAARILACAVSAAASCGPLSSISTLTSLELNFNRVEGWYYDLQAQQLAAAHSSDDDDSEVDEDDYYHVADADDDEDDEEDYQLGPVTAAMTEELSRITQLRRLSLDWPPSIVNPLWRPLSNLAQLTALTMIDMCFEDQHHPFQLQLPHGPTSLQHLALIPSPHYYSAVTSIWLQPHGSYTQALDSLHNLKSLTELRAPGSRLDTSLKLLSLDGALQHLFPDSLEVLELQSVTKEGIQQLLRLPKLRALTFEAAAELTGWQLLLLEGMRSLTSLQLNYYASADIDESWGSCTQERAERMVSGLCDTMEVHAAHWPALPLRRLSIDASVCCSGSYCGTGWYYDAVEGYQISVRATRQRVDAAPFVPVDSPILHGLAQLTRLTYLGLRCDLPHGFASIVSQLTGLQELRLANAFEPDWSAADCMCHDGWKGECLDAMQSLMHAVGQLPQLEHLAMQWLCELLYPAAAEELSHARLLQRLELWADCPLTAIELESIVRSGAARRCVVCYMPLAAGEQLPV